jgi:ADP-ribose pyrophosphatase YjhB (NUDIX family)
VIAPQGGMRTRLLRAGYRVAYVGLVAWSRIVRPRTRGVKILVFREGRVLLVRHSYGPGDWDVPGGFCRRNEAFAEAARRELGEELGIGDAAWTDLGRLAQHRTGRREALGCFRADLGAQEPRILSAELREADWFAPGALPDGRAQVVDRMLALVPAPER